MAVVEESSSYKAELADHSTSSHCSSSSIVKETRNLALDDTLTTKINPTGAKKLTAAFPKVENEPEDEDDEDFDESNHNFLYNQLLNPAKAGHPHAPPQCMRGALERKSSSRSLHDLSGRSLDFDDDKSWHTLSSVHSRTDLEDEKSWQKLDSVHSRSSVARSACFDHSGELDDSNSSNDSETSFASFDSEGEEAELSAQKAAFTNLSDESTPRTVLFNTQRMRNTGTSLSFIDEKSSLE
ncbi:hypothetical protein FisN_22Lh123 [Fistulifera solaris]|uniref:Uncharacterized protein n=1 Tax=Fistulifera solaris TaxID=1519565 RepID=A0A1Z5JBW1_FISSO|nr:hypothetical protein FisN_22Lh123 [Fistulifera solaris]|eukprot:GAX11439.1 hypothetical protein FisN_22Lh123 [Fistulifera solaris]